MKFGCNVAKHQRCCHDMSKGTESQFAGTDQKDAWAASQTGLPGNINGSDGDDDNDESGAGSSV